MYILLICYEKDAVAYLLLDVQYGIKCLKHVSLSLIRHSVNFYINFLCSQDWRKCFQTICGVVR